MFWTLSLSFSRRGRAIVSILWATDLKTKNGQHGMFSWGEGRKLDDLKEKFWVAALSNFGSNGHLTRKVSTHYSELVTQLYQAN
jgi:hypothetical protein